MYCHFFHLSSVPMWLWSIFFSGDHSEGSIARSLQRRLHVSDSAVLPLQVCSTFQVYVWLHVYGLEHNCQLWIHTVLCVKHSLDSLVSVCAFCYVSGRSHAFVFSTLCYVHWQHVRACLHVVSFHTWLSSLSPQKTSKVSQLFTLSAEHVCWFASSRGQRCNANELDIIIERQHTKTCLIWCKWTFL